MKSEEWKPGDLNVLIGPNASGKTNLLRALQLLSLSAQGKLKKHIQREGGMHSILWDGQAEELGFRVLLNDDEFDFPANYELVLGESTLLGFSVMSILTEILSNPITCNSNDSIQKHLIKAGLNSGKGYLGGIGGIEPGNFTQEHASGIALGETELSEARGDNGVTSKVKSSFSNWSIYLNFRTDRNADVRRSRVASSDTKVELNGQNLISVLHTLYTTNREFENEINIAMQSAFDDKFEKLTFPPADDQRIQMRIRWSSLKREQSTADISDGTLRFLYLITILANPSPPALIAIDEPEAGLHPSMLPIVAEYAREASRKTQIIFSTHSPEFLDAFGKEPPTTTVVELQEGETKLRLIADEDLDYWIKNYTLGELQRSGELEAMP